MRNLQIFLLLASMFIYASCKSDSEPKSEKPTQEVTNIKKTASKESKVRIQKKRKNEPELEIENASLSAIITLGNIDYSLINARLFQKINEERRRLNLPSFKNNNNLKRAAKLHNDYMVRADILDHNQSGTSTPQLRDRIDRAGGNFRTAGENIQYEGFTIRTTNGVESILAPTYEALAEQLWQNWKVSPPHYKNLTNPEFLYLGTSLKWSSKKTAIFATQVYGG